MSKILLPQNYISQSQIMMWQNDPEKYVRKYMLREDETIWNSGIGYGKKMSDAWEGNEQNLDFLDEALLCLFPKYDAIEHELKVDWNDITLLGKIDTFDTKTFNFRERKTGRVPWTARKASGSFQIWFYATLVYLKHKKVLHEAYLDWAETEEVDGVVSPTGRIESFRVVFTLSGILQTLATVSKVAKEISARYREEMAKLA